MNEELTMVENNEVAETEYYEVEDSHIPVIPFVIGGIVAAGTAVGAVIYKKFGGEEKVAEIKETKKAKKIEKLKAKIEKLEKVKEPKMVKIEEAIEE